MPHFSFENVKLGSGDEGGWKESCEGDDFVKEQSTNLFIEHEAKGTNDGRQEGGTDVRAISVRHGTIEFSHLFSVKQIVELGGEGGGAEGAGATKGCQINAEEGEDDVKEETGSRPNRIDGERRGFGSGFDDGRGGTN